jgi:hypothetical protein
MRRASGQSSEGGQALVFAHLILEFQHFLFATSKRIRNLSGKERDQGRGNHECHPHPGKMRRQSRLRVFVRFENWQWNVKPEEQPEAGS